VWLKATAGVLLEVAAVFPVVSSMVVPYSTPDGVTVVEADGVVIGVPAQ
jgi:hypothetical protein